MSLAQKLGKAILNSEYVTRHVRKYKTDADYRYQVQENILLGTVAVGVFGLLIGGMVWAIKAEDTNLAGDIVRTVRVSDMVDPLENDGLCISLNELNEIIVSNERGYFETPVGMFGVEFFGEGSQIFGE